ncbi:uncharacterized protein METZ01_LOCUS437269, partial [marine metagenome]
MMGCNVFDDNQYLPVGVSTELGNHKYNG